MDWLQWGYSEFAPLLDEVVDGSGVPPAWEQLHRMVDASWDQGLGVSFGTLMA